jgi:two-component system, cell cycle response regulator DivK
MPEPAMAGRPAGINRSARPPEGKPRRLGGRPARPLSRRRSEPWPAEHGTMIAQYRGFLGLGRSRSGHMQQRRILIVEDNHDNRAIFAAILHHSGYEVLEAADGASGVRLARERHPDVILMDISLPKMNGLEATSVLKADAATSHIPIIAVTAHAMPDDERRVREVGCDAYLTKPVEPARVVEEVSRFLGDEAPQSSASR